MLTLTQDDLLTISPPGTVLALCAAGLPLLRTSEMFGKAISKARRYPQYSWEDVGELLRKADILPQLKFTSWLYTFIYIYAPVPRAPTPPLYGPPRHFPFLFLSLFLPSFFLSLFPFFLFRPSTFQAISTAHHHHRREGMLCNYCKQVRSSKLCFFNEPSLLLHTIK